jgi:hypothetical protein
MVMKKTIATRTSIIISVVLKHAKRTLGNVCVDLLLHFLLVEDI